MISDIEKAKLANSSINEYVDVLIEHSYEAVKPTWISRYLQGLTKIRERSQEIERSLINNG